MDQVWQTINIIRTIAISQRSVNFSIRETLYHIVHRGELVDLTFAFGQVPIGMCNIMEKVRIFIGRPW